MAGDREDVRDQSGVDRLVKIQTSLASDRPDFFSLVRHHVTGKIFRALRPRDSRTPVAIKLGVHACQRSHAAAYEWTIEQVCVRFHGVATAVSAWRDAF